MGTRGAYGFRVNNQDKVTYNHSDSYPSWLGVNIVKFIQETPLEELRAIAEGIILVSEDNKPTEEQQKECLEYLDLSVGNQTSEDWYNLLRNAQGDLGLYRLTRKYPLHYMIDSASFLVDSLFCEYAYIINLDSETLECYRGFNKSPHGAGRYASLYEDNPYYDRRYYGVMLVGEISIADIQEMDPEEFEDALNHVYGRDTEIE